MLDIPGLPLPEPVTRYIRFPDGVLGRITVVGDLEPELPDGAKYVTQEVYEELRAELREQHDTRVAEMLAAEKDARRQQYEDLVAAGIREATARALSGHGGPLDDDSALTGAGGTDEMRRVG
ncbi:hypothetical protein OOK58_43075 [Streptomyces sp. NBC_01728]|uniref:hypothetical protein n=1 Tax=unclassified Streptomyces TaxID=2593676 RepID=UPI0022559900|nr:MULTISPECIES: hypothetical protein [unclassified Streptomyces]MCX4458696.1 hypothetical protein [Streptomyces sp. NBC_01719]MCX4498053.1 hypothetical protein [Streptomyces sp. NBC_01728]